MIFSAYLDPESITAVDDGGGVGNDHLLGVMRSLLESCFLAESYSWTIGKEALRVIQNLKDPDTRLKAGALLEMFSKRDRFVPLLDDAALPENASMTDLGLAQAENPELDLIITEGTPAGDAMPEFTPISQFNRSNFESRRQRLVSDGVTISPGRLSGTDLFERCFGRMLLGCDSFTIEDYMIGNGFGENYYRNLPQWCDFFSSCGRKIEVTIQTQETSQNTVNSMKTRLEELSGDTLVSFKIKTVENPRHERFFRSPAFSLQIGRGIDLCDSSGMNRDIKINLGK